MPPQRKNYIDTIHIPMQNSNADLEKKITSQSNYEKNSKNDTIRRNTYLFYERLSKSK